MNGVSSFQMGGRGGRLHNDSFRDERESSGVAREMREGGGGWFSGRRGLKRVGRSVDVVHG